MKYGEPIAHIRIRTSIGAFQREPLPLLAECGIDLDVYDKLDPQVRHAAMNTKTNLDVRPLLDVPVTEAVKHVMMSDGYWNQRIRDMIAAQDRRRHPRVA